MARRISNGIQSLIYPGYQLKFSQILLEFTEFILEYARTDFLYITIWYLVRAYVKWVNDLTPDHSRHKSTNIFDVFIWNVKKQVKNRTGYSDMMYLLSMSAFSSGGDPNQKASHLTLSCGESSWNEQSWAGTRK